MKRIALLSLLTAAALACWHPAASAQSSMDVVPPLHWSYAALDLLMIIGELEGYPDGYFDADSDYRAENGVALRRYELEQAVARAQVSTWNKLNWQQGYVEYLVSDLCHEFNNPPDHNPDPALDDCQCHWVVSHGLAVPEDHWSYNAVRDLVDAGLIEVQPGMPVAFPLGQQDMRSYTRLATEALAGWPGTAEAREPLEITVECLEREYFDPFAPFRTGYQTITDWICPALDYLAATGYIDGYAPDYFDISAPHFASPATMPTMQDCYDATQVFSARLAAMQAAGEHYPPHLDQLAADLADVCKEAAPAEVEEAAEPEQEEEEPERRIRFKPVDDPIWK